MIMKKIILWMLPLIPVIMLVVMNIAQSAGTVNVGETLHDIEGKQYVLKQEKKELEELLAKAKSLNTLHEEAVALGFIPVSSVTFVEPATPVAMR
jgi:hypothetical protein